MGTKYYYDATAFFRVLHRKCALHHKAFLSQFVLSLPSENQEISNNYATCVENSVTAKDQALCDNYIFYFFSHP